MKGYVLLTRYHSLYSSNHLKLETSKKEPFYLKKFNSKASYYTPWAQQFGDQENQKIKASLDCLVRPYLKENQTKQFSILDGKHTRDPVQTSIVQMFIDLSLL